MMIRHSDSRSPEQARKLALWVHHGAWLAILLGIYVPALLLILNVMPSAVLLLWPLEIPAQIMAEEVAGWACRAAGVAQEGRHTETIQRSAGAALAAFLSDAPQFQLAGTGGLRGHTSVDREGISAGRKGEKRVLWRDVESCDVAQSRGVTGEASTTLSLRDRAGREMLRLLPGESDAQALTAAVRFYLRGEGAEAGGRLRN